MKRRIWPSGLALVIACQEPVLLSEEALQTTESPAIYGEDDRLDWYAVTDPALRDLTSHAIVAFIEPSNLDESDPFQVTIDAPTLQQTTRLCEGERFTSQPAAASCSATLIDDDLILTAGHCARGRQMCESMRFVFRYYMESEGALATILHEDVFRCAEVVVRNEGFTRDGVFDHGIIRLDRRATPRFTPAPVARGRSPVRVGDPVTIIGFGSGLPAKIDSGGRVTSIRAVQQDYFEATTDSFGGNSGSGVFNAAGEVVGILARGQQDYRFQGGCVVPVRFAEGGSRSGAEGISYAWRAVDELCAGGFASPRLCDTEPSCGDGRCSPGEEATCDEDCRVEVPDAWTCDPAQYGAGDGCDCACGAPDLDCADPAQPVSGCGDDEICSRDGTCTEPASRPEVPSAWTCDPAWYDMRDGCDCDCGAPDPDCDVAGQPVVHCAPGEVCSAEGACVAPPGPAPDAGGDPSPDAAGDGTGAEDEEGGGVRGRGRSGCVAAAPSPSGVPWWWGLGALLAWRRVARRPRHRGGSARTAA